MDNNKIKQNMLLLFEHPQEPLFMARGETNAMFDVPERFLTDRYRPIGSMIQERFGEMAQEKIPVKDIVMPDMRIPMSLGRRENFSLFIPRHRNIAGRLIDTFMGMRSLEDLQSLAVFARDRCNPYLFVYALSVALLHRSDTKDVSIPELCHVFPDRFIDSQVFAGFREEAMVMPDGSRMPIEIPRDFTGSDLEVEHRLWYFREDLGINLHHWHWHLVYPYEASDPEIVAKDRRGELFYYMHQQILGRYNLERFSNRLARVEPFNNFRETIQTGYFPKLDSAIASRNWPGRASDVVLKDINRQVDMIRLDLEDIERWRDRIYEAIQQGFIFTEDGSQLSLDDEAGIDILGNIIESSILSPNRQLYGDLHNMGHVFISFCHDPDNRHLESFGVMGDTATAMRDPFFYRWHAFIDTMFQAHKNRLEPYSMRQLRYQGVKLTGVDIVTQGGRPNVIETFWQQSDAEFSRGLDFVPRGSIFARFTHLQHQPFHYRITVSNKTRSPLLGTVRIFLGPNRDERGQPLSFDEQRLLMIELDKFVTSFAPGETAINRSSTESAVTIPFNRTFRNLDENRPAANTPAEAEFNICGCGWPEHMLIPRGLPEGLQCQLFVMISDYEEDRIDQDTLGGCDDAAVFCGLRDRLYPDKRPMGYPFDRRPRSGVFNLRDFITPNMLVQNVVIVSSDRITVRT